MDPKIAFGRDFLSVMRSLQLSAAPKQFDPIADAAIRFFLITWGLTSEEADRANKAFLQQADQANPPPFRTSFERLVGHIKKDRAAAQRLVIQAAAIASLDFDISDDELTFVRGFQEHLDLTPSEGIALAMQGADWASGLHFFGRTYAEYKKK